MDQVVDVHLLQRHGALKVLDDLDVAPEAAQPGDYLLRVRHIAAEQQQLHGGRDGQDHPLVMVAAIRISQPLVFINDQ